MKLLKSDFVKENGWLLTYWDEDDVYCISVRTDNNVETVVAKYYKKRGNLSTSYVLPLNVIYRIYMIIEKIEGEDFELWRL